MSQSQASFVAAFILGGIVGGTIVYITPNGQRPAPQSPHSEVSISVVDGRFPTEEGVIARTESAELKSRSRVGNVQTPDTPPHLLEFEAQLAPNSNYETEDEPPFPPPHETDPGFFEESEEFESEVVEFDQERAAEFIRDARAGGVPDDHVAFLTDAMKSEGLEFDLDAADDAVQWSQEVSDLTEEEIADMMADDLSRGPLTDAEVQESVDAFWEDVSEREDQLFEDGDGAEPHNDY